MRFSRCAAYLRALEQKKAALGYTDENPPKNSGKFRTPEKRRLLKALDDNARASGRRKPFDGNY